MTMADAQVESTVAVSKELVSQYAEYKSRNNNHPFAANNNHHMQASRQRKRKTLTQVVDKLVTQVTPAHLNNNVYHHNNNNDDIRIKQEMLDHAPGPYNKACKLDDGDSIRFDGSERLTVSDDEVFSPASSSNKSPHSSNTDSPKISFSPLRLKDSGVEEDQEICTPPSSRPTPKPEGKSSKGPEAAQTPVPASHRPYQGCNCTQCITGLRFPYYPHDRFFPLAPIPDVTVKTEVPSKSDSDGSQRPFPEGFNPSLRPPYYPQERFNPANPSSPQPAPVYSFEQYLHSKYLPDFFRRRSHSDSDIPMWFEAKTERSDQSDRGTVLRQPNRSQTFSNESSPQDSPLDLSMKSSRNSSSTASDLSPTSIDSPAQVPSLQLLPGGYLPPRGTVPVPVVKGDVASPTTKDHAAVPGSSLWFLNLEVSPVVEEMPPGSDVAYVCPVCGQMFSLHDRLAKHMASRHKSRAQATETSTKAYMCDVCKRPFARSDMLTRHMRLHTGVKPYTCRVCGQVFSRSDHLSTHQRTHTGEKPYKCPQCPYAACRRDMITRHLRTHARYDPSSGAPPPMDLPDDHLSSPSSLSPPSAHLDGEDKYQPINVPKISLCHD